jgi:hypothetical protein
VNFNLGLVFVKWFLVNLYGFTEAIAQSDGFRATPGVTPVQINEKPVKSNVIMQNFVLTLY